MSPPLNLGLLQSKDGALWSLYLSWSLESSRWSVFGEQKSLEENWPSPLLDLWSHPHTQAAREGDCQTPWPPSPIWFSLLLAYQSFTSHTAHLCLSRDPSPHLEYHHTSSFLQKCSKFTLFCHTSLSNGSQGWSFPLSCPARVKGIFHTVLFYPWIPEIFFSLGNACPSSPMRVQAP